MALFVFATMATTGCDESFSPVEPSGLQYSIFGYLDASADRQWIRVMPLRPVVLTSPGPLGATVTLEHLGSGRVVELRDSVFRFQRGAGVGSDGVYLHNYWTTERIEPGASYRLLVSREGETPSAAVVEIPPDYEVEVWIAQPRSGGGDRLRVVGLKDMPFTIVTRFDDTCGPAINRDPLTTRSEESEIHLIRIWKRFVFREGCGSSRVEKRDLLIIGSGAAWPSGPEYSSTGLGVPDVTSNISHSVGFLGGVLTRVVPYEDCLIESLEDRPEPCRLRYDEASATLGGTVRSTCGGAGIAGADVRLREIDPDPSGRRKTRPTATNRSGEFEIGALEAGRRYHLGIRGLSPDFRDLYQEYGDTLQFAAGERATHDAVLTPVNPCGTEG